MPHVGTWIETTYVDGIVGVSVMPQKDLVVLCALRACAASNKYYKVLKRGKNTRDVSLYTAEIEQILKMVVDVSLPVRLVADLHGVTPSRVYRLVCSYRKTGQYPIPAKRGHPLIVVSSDLRQTILSAKLELRLGTKSLGRYLREVRSISVGNRAVHRILLEKKMTIRQPQKGIRNRPWVRYEREFRLEAVHMDWHQSKYNGKLVCIVLDDASRMILA